MKTTSVSGHFFLIMRASSNPSGPGMRTSVKTTSNDAASSLE